MPKKGKPEPEPEVVEEVEPEMALLIVQTEALCYEEEIRKRVTQEGFKIKQQTLAQLSEEKARKYNMLSYKIKADENTRLMEEYEDRYREAEELGEPFDEKPPELSEDGLKPTVDEQDEVDRLNKALSGGPMLVLGLWRMGAVEGLEALMGDEQEAGTKNPDLKEDGDSAEVGEEQPAGGEGADQASLRAVFGKSPLRCGVRGGSSTHPLGLTLIDAQREFFFGSAEATGLEDDGGRKNLKKSNISDKVSLEQLLKFLFPPKVQHPLSTGRLFVFALYGPLDRDSKLRAGYMNQHVVTSHELDTMANTISREDILSVYAGQGLAPEEEEEILAQADGAMKFIPQYVTDDVERILKLVPRDEDGLMSFHDMQGAISKARAKHVKRLKAAMLALTKKKNKHAPTSAVEEKDR
jgi:saccharopepsin